MRFFYFQNEFPVTPGLLYEVLGYLRLPPPWTDKQGGEMLRSNPAQKGRQGGGHESIS